LNGESWDSNGDLILDEPRDDVTENCETLISEDEAGAEAPPGEQPPSGGKGKGGGEDPPPANESIVDLKDIIDGFSSQDLNKGEAKNLKATLDVAAVEFGNGGFGDPDGCNTLAAFEDQVNGISPNKISPDAKTAILAELNTNTKAANGC